MPWWRGYEKNINHYLVKENYLTGYFHHSVLNDHIQMYALA